MTITTELNDFRTVHRATADYEVYIEWSGVGCKGHYNTWVIKDFTFELNETQEQLIDKWVKIYAPEATSWLWTLKPL